MLLPLHRFSRRVSEYYTISLVTSADCFTLRVVWYRLNNLNNQSKKTRLSKVYFTWVIRDFGTAEWFHSLLHAIEEQDVDNKIEISIYLTAKIKEDDMNNIVVSVFICAPDIAF